MVQFLVLVQARLGRKPMPAVLALERRRLGQVVAPMVLEDRLR